MAELSSTAYMTDSISPFSDGLSLACIGDTSYYLYSDGKHQRLPGGITFYPYSSGMAKVKKNIKGQDRYGYIDTKGDITIEDLYQDVKANVQSNSVWINDSEQTPELISGPGIDENWKSWKL